jgi:hypothetical protein
MDKEQVKVVKGFGYSITEIPGLKRVPTMTFYNKNGREMPNLPADPYSLKHYLSKGFTLEPPKENSNKGE